MKTIILLSLLGGLAFCGELPVSAMGSRYYRSQDKIPTNYSVLKSTVQALIKSGPTDIYEVWVGTGTTASHYLVFYDSGAASGTQTEVYRIPGGTTAGTVVWGATDARPVRFSKGFVVYQTSSAVPINWVLKYR